MNTFSNKDYIYIGREAGKEILSKIKNAKSSVKIVSPYLSSSYILELLNLHKKGVKITLITCDDLVSERNPHNDFNTQDLIKKEKLKNPNADKSRKTLLNYFILLFIASFISLISGLFFSLNTLLVLMGLFLLADLIIFIGYFSVKDYYCKYSTIFRIKVFDSHSGEKPWSTELIHSKIFVIDNELAFLGSANFTYSGFKTHYETVIRIEDKNAIKSISEEVEALFNSKELREKTVEEWGA